MDRRVVLLVATLGVYVTISGAKPYHNKKSHLKTKTFRDEYQSLPSDPFANLPAVPVKKQFMSWDPNDLGYGDSKEESKLGKEDRNLENVMSQQQLKEADKQDVCKDVFCHEGRVCEVSPTGFGQCVCAAEEHCKGHKKEVCGTDGKIYPSHCELHRAACIQGHPIAVDHSQKGCTKKPTSPQKDKKKTRKNKSEKMDKSRVVQSSEYCSLEPLPGPCKGYFLKWYYDAELGECKQFVYGGCRGNNNRFTTQDECEDRCIIREQESKDVAHKKIHRKKGYRGHKQEVNAKDVIPTPPPSTPTPTPTPSTTLETEDVDLDAQSAEDMRKEAVSTETTDLCTDLEYERLKAELLRYHCERIEESDCQEGITEKQLVANIMLNYYDRDSDGQLTEDELDDIEHRDHLDKLNRYCSLTHMLTYDDTNEDELIDNKEFFKAFKVPRVVLEEHLKIFSTQVTAGNSIELKCDIKGGETIIWKRNGASLEQVTTNDIKTFEDGSLYINNLGLHHMGNYTCQDINEDTIIQTHVLRVQLPPQVKVSPSTQFHTSGVTVKLKCHADGIPEPEIMWEKNEAPLPEDLEARHYIRLYNNRTLEIKDAVYTRDTGAYKCKARNSAGVGQDIATVFIENSHVPVYQPGEEGLQDMYEVFVVFHDKGYTVYEPGHCHVEHQVTGAFSMFKTLPEYGDTLSTLCPVNADCSWGSAVNVRNKFIYITQPEQNRVIVIEIQDRSNPVEVIPTDKIPVSIRYVEHLDQVWILCWNGESDTGSKTTVVVRQASQEMQHHTVHTQPIANRFDLVKDVFLPSNNDLRHKFVHGYVVHQDQKDLYKLDLEAMKYVKTIDLGNYDCVPHSVSFVPLGGQILVHCKAAIGEIETNSLLVLDYVTDKIMEQKRLNGDSFVSPDSRYMVVVDDDGDTITVHKINDDGKIEKLYDEYTNLHVSDVTFFPSDRGHSYDFYATSTNRNEVLYMSLASGKVEMIDGVGEAINPSEWRWSKHNRVIVSGGVFGEYLMTPSRNSVVVIDGNRRHVQCEWQDIAHGNIIVWVDPLHL